MKTYASLLAVLLALPLSAEARPTLLASSDKNLNIAAIVGDEAISSYDVDSRIRFIIATTGMTDSPEVVEHIRPQVLRSLIDEHLQLQEATKNGIKVTPQDIDAGIASIEAQRSMPAGSIFQMLDAKGVPHDTFVNEIHAQLAWNKLVIKKIKPTVKISDEEIQMAYHQGILKPVSPDEELQIAVLVLPVDKPARENEEHQVADKLVKEVRGGANFDELARQFSGGAKKSSGALDTFWVKPDQIDPDLANALKGVKAGGVTDPVRGPEGYKIVKVYATRGAAVEQAKESDVKLKEILIKIKPDAKQKEADALVQIGEDVSKHPGTCEDKGVAGIENAADYDISVDMTHEHVSELPKAIQLIVSNLKKGEMSTPYASESGIRLYMLCDIKELPPEAAEHDRIGNAIFAQRMDLEVEKYMRDLRRDTYIQIR